MSDWLSFSRTLFVRLLCACVVVVFVLRCAPGVAAQNAGGPRLLSEGTGTTTRAVALESVNFVAEPFSVNMAVAWNGDTRTRVTLFAMNLDLLPGEGANALTADAQDGNGNIYPLKVEYVGRVPQQEWLYAVVVRLHDDMTNTLGDVLVRINLHGTASNRVRLAIGRTGGGPPDDSASIPTPAPLTPPAPTPAATPRAYGPGETSNADTVRFLEQASWGPMATEVARVQSMGLRAYLNEQFSAPMSSYPVMPLMPGDATQGCPDPTTRNACVRDNYSMYPLQVKFFQNAMTGQDQLRQRVAFALHQIMVVSGRDITQPSWMSPYLRTLDRHAFGNFRQLLFDITLNPAMGRYLDTVGSTRTNPNENFAREILQLFSVGLDELNPDGTPKLDAQGNRIPTYTQDTVDNFTRVFTGWTFAPPPAGSPQGVTNYLDPLIVARASNHDTNSKQLFNGVTLPPNQTALQDLNAALDNIFNHPNVGPFISKQLIQHLVTSNPSPAYVQRVASVFNNDCAGLYPENCQNVRGDLKAVVRAILLDPEARGDVKTDPNYGKLREPVQLINNLLRAFNASAFGNASLPSDGYLVPNASTLDQDVFRPQSVFSYYPPDYEVPGAKILGPAFAILSTSTTLRRANFVNTIVHTGVPVNANAPSGTQLNFTTLESQANNPAQLVNTLDALLLHGTMSAQMRASVTTAVNAIPATDSNFARKRVQMAVYLVASSSQYQVER